MRAPALAAAVALLALAAACGDEPRESRPEPVVRLTLGAPADGVTVRSESVEIRGAVQPRAAQVRVLGRTVTVERGEFRTEVELEPGANLIDVAAGAQGRRPDFAAMRIVREVRVPVPDLVGGDADSAQEQLEGLGLSARTEDAGGFFDPILPGDPKVCEQRPRAGAEVQPGAEVTLRIARDC